MISAVVKINIPRRENSCLMSYANNKCADQPMCLRSLNIAFVVRCLDSITPIYAIYTEFQDYS